jgi:uncharacterized protein YdeI (YjbR/CyaY-like superfamily)
MTATPKRFADAAAWSKWLAAHHGAPDGLWLLLAKKGTKGLSYVDALEVALAWGWIDAHKRPIDDAHWTQRFTPRRKASAWSKINCGKAEALIAAGKMHAPGLAEVTRAKADGRWAGAYDGARTATVPDDLLQALATKPNAAAFFETLDRANRYAILYRLQTAKKPATRASRIEKFVDMLEKHETLHPPRRR